MKPKEKKSRGKYDLESEENKQKSVVIEMDKDLNKD